MKKSLFFIIASLFFCIAIEAGVRSKNEAQDVASRFLSKSQSQLRNQTGSQKLTLEYVSNNRKTGLSSEEVYYYVFNVNENDGFVIVGGDDRTKEILGYSEKGRFDIQSIPENLRYWLSCYEIELDELDMGIIIPQWKSPSSSKLRAGTYAVSIAPFVSTIWDQGAPYNNLCPMIPNANGQRSVTGCVATGTAQIMNYYKWPNRGTGSNSYVTATNRIPLSLDFSSVVFDWGNMLDSYSEPGLQITAAQQNAVATLMFSCGVACNMDYGFSSGAYSIDMASALIRNFGYDENLQYCQRDYFAQSEWEDMIKTELNAGRPVAYAGTSSEGGHYFVCDGYDSDDLYHFNWGWSSMSDGYFQLSALNPSAVGIGGSSGGFNLGQEIIIGIQPPSSTSIPSYQIYFLEPLSVSSTTVNIGAPFTVTASSLYNVGVNSFSGSFGIGLYDPASGSLEYSFMTETLSTPLLSLDGWSTLGFPGSIPNTVTPGNYELYLIYQAAGESDWNIIRGKAGTLNHYLVTVTTSQVTFTAPANEFPQLTINSLTLGTNLYQNEYGVIEISLTNSGNEYNSLFRFYLKSNTTSVVTALYLDEPVEIASGETKTIEFQKYISVVPGQYTLIVDYDANNDEYSPVFTPFSTTLNVTVEATPSQVPALTLMSPVSFPNPQKVNKRAASLTATIKNTGGLFEDYVIAYVFPAMGGMSLAYFGYQELILDSNQEQVVTFSEYIDLAPGQYLVQIYYWNNVVGTWIALSPSSNASTLFTLVDEGTGSKDGVTISNGVSLYPNPVSSNLYLNAPEVVKTIQILDLTGKQIAIFYPDMKGTIEVNVGFLNRGTYILRYVTERDTCTERFIKK